MNKLLLFCDGSVNVQNNVGYGAYLALDEDDLIKQKYPDIQLKRFENTSSTKLELQTLLWAFNDIKLKNRQVVVFTDSQNIVGLKSRRKRIEKNDFKSKKGILLKNHELYRQFYLLMDLLDVEIIKIKGHQSSRFKNDMERIFGLVDKTSRKMLKKEFNPK